MGTFGTSTNPSHYVEVPDTLNPGQARRPSAGLVIKVRDHQTGQALPDVTTLELGYWAASYPGHDLIQVSADGGVTWVGPLVSSEALQAGFGAALSFASTGRTPRVWQQATEPTALAGALDGDWWVDLS